MKTVQTVALLLTIIGAINWGLVGLFDFNLVEYLLGEADELIPKVVYAVVGFAGIVNIGLLFKTSTGE